MSSHRFSRFLLSCLLLVFCGLTASFGFASTVDIDDIPLFLGGNGTPLTLLVMGRDHKLYYEAYNDASDLNGDGVVDVGYKPNMIDMTQKDSDGNYTIPLDYYGYFDSHKCYTYNTSTNRFEPSSITTTKKCSNAWSGDFLNYLTTSRMDALRRVLYGGYRSTDTASTTILERAYISQDAHSWGKEYPIYNSSGNNISSYTISDYAPLSEPPAGKRHLFANTTLLCPVPSGYTADSGCDSNVGAPLLRVLTNSAYRVWEWLSIERPVAGKQCATGNNSRASCETSGGTIWEIVPSSIFSNLTLKTYKYQGSHPSSHTAFNTILTNYAISSNLIGSGSATYINCTSSQSCNPFSSQQDYYLTIFSGTLNITTAGTYTFAVDGDDAVELLIDGTVVASYYDGHSLCSCQTHSGSISLSAGSHTIEFRHEEQTGDSSYYLYWQRTIPASAMTDYVVRVQACVSGLLESECQAYPAGASTPTAYKPVGLLQQYGEPEKMAFGLLTGSYRNNLSGGVLRKNISPLVDTTDPTNGAKSEINTNNGTFNINTSPTTATPGVIGTIDRLKIYGFGSSYYHNLDCQVPEVTAMKQGRCRMWGNPIAEMMYEGLRYFAGKSAGSSVFTNGVSTSGSDDDATLKLPLPTWKDPYRATSEGGYPRCSKPFELVISDINPSFDTDQLPGTYFSTGNPVDKDSNHSMTLGDDLGDLNVSTKADTIWSKESEGTKVFIGQSGTTYDNAPTPKTVSSFKNIRGLSPEEPTRQGGFYAASVAYYGHTRSYNNGPGFGPGQQDVDTFSVALASPLPRIEIPITTTSGTTTTTKTVTLVPFAKSVGGSGINSAQGQFQPTNTIVDFYVDTLKNTGTANTDTSVNSGRPYGKFRINFEDSEYGSDHDMDAIVTYTFTVNADNTLTVTLTSDYAAGGVIQHMGYVISGSDHDGVYLEVRDSDTGASSDPDYFLDTPAGCYPYDPNSSDPKAQLTCRQDNVALPSNTSLSSTRTFTAGTSSAVFIKHDPLWYAAKWGGFLDDAAKSGDPTNGANTNTEWDADNNGVPDNYFLVTNASRLKTQLSQAFQQIISQQSSAAAVAINTGTLTAGSRIYQAEFHSQDWSGHLRAYSLNPNGSLKQKEWDAADTLNAQDFDTGRVILTYKPSTAGGVAFRWPSGITNSTPTATPTSTQLDTAQANALKGSDTPSVGTARLEYLRGSKDNEGDSGLKFRTRKETAETTLKTRVPFVLGDIVNSSPAYIAAPQTRFDLLLTATDAATERTAYSTFRSTYNSRTPMVYVGANDGMLHGFAAADGTEKIAYVPNLIFSNLAALTSTSYNSNHLYFVDGSPKIGDVYYGNDTAHPENNWHTLLVGILRKGGKGLFALDITNPTTTSGSTVTWNFTEANAATLVRWEFTDADLGYTFSQPSLARLHNGQWAAVFGNGYNNTGTTGHAILYAIDARTGGNTSATPAGFKIKVDTGIGSTGTPNGLSTPLMVDLDSDGIVDYAYAGDLYGNLWRFDLTSPTPSSWTAKLLFTAKDASGNTQPITAKPQAVRHPNGGLIILVGTGRYLGSTDVTTTAQQTFYGIWDQDLTATPPTISRSLLQGQTMTTVTVTETVTETSLDETGTPTTTTTTKTVTFRVSTANQVCWKGTTCTVSGVSVTGTKLGWFMDLPGLTGNPAERVVSDLSLVGNDVVFTSIAPSDDPCAAGGSSWLNVLDAITGQRVDESFVTLTGGTTENPAVTATPIKVSTTIENGTTTSVAPTSLQYNTIVSAPTKMDSAASVNIYMTDSSGNIRTATLSAGGVSGRLSWRQLEFVQ